MLTRAEVRREHVLYALSFWQPWGWAMFHGKSMENRSWHPPKWMIGRVMVIHAAKKYDNVGFEALREQMDRPSPSPRTITRGAVIGLARLTGSYDRIAVLPRPPARAACGCSGIWHAGTCVNSDPWFCGPVGWRFTEATELQRPVPCRGHQGLWKLPPELLPAVLEALDAAHGPVADGIST